MRNSTLKFCAMLLAICTSTIHLQAMDEWDGKTIAKGFYSGTGTKTDPYKIFTASQFLYFIQQTKDGNSFSDKYIELCNDIAFNHEPVEGGDFYGDFDGNDHTIQVNSFFGSRDAWRGWTLFNLYGSMHDVQFIRANEVMSIYTGGILYNCRFEFPSSSYHGRWTVYLEGGTIANCVSNSAHYQNGSKYGGSYGLVYGDVSSSHCSNCNFPITSYSYGGTLASNYYGVEESCGEEAGNEWVLSHTVYPYKSWPLTFSPTYSEYQIKEQPLPYNPSVECPNSDEALFQWCYQERKPITFEDITFSSNTQTKNIVVSDDDVILSFDFKADGYVYTGYNDFDDELAWISVNGEKIVSTYHDEEGTYSCQASAGTYEISCVRSDILNIRITYPTDILFNEISSTLSKQAITEKPGAYFCQVSYGEGCDVMNSDYVDYEKLLTIDGVTYVINEDATATLLWVADMAVDIAIPETVNYDDVNYPVTSISSKAFVDCSSLASIKCKTMNVPALLGGITFEGLIPSNITLYVSIGSESAYSASEGWKEFGVILEMEFAIEIVDGQTFDNNDDRVVGEISYTRTFTNTAWQSLYVPFEIPVTEELLADFEVADLNDIRQYDRDDDGVKDETVVEAFKVKSGATLAANYPYLIRAKEVGEKTITVTDATLYATEEVSIDCSSVHEKFTFTGTYSRKASDELAGCYALCDGVWQPLAADATLGAFRVYLRIESRDSNIAPARAIRMHVVGEDGATDIDELESNANNQQPAVVYDLQGRRITNVDNLKGVYIVNGKKVVK